MNCYFYSKNIQIRWLNRQSQNHKKRLNSEWKSKRKLSFSPPINLLEEGKWLLAVSSFECTNSVFNITKENISFWIIIPGQYQTEFAEKMIIDLNKLLELKSLELHVEEVKKEEIK